MKSLGFAMKLSEIGVMPDMIEASLPNCQEC